MDSPVRIWWLTLCAAAVVNVCGWTVAFVRYRRKTAEDPSFVARRRQLILSAIYVAVCAFRGILPRADVQRICLFDTYLSSIAVGRSVATIAELCSVLQWALLADEMGRAAQSRALHWISRICVWLIVFAEVCSWYAVLTTNYLGNAVEESCWTLLAALVALGMLVLLRTPGGQRLRAYLVCGVLGCVGYMSFMASVDVRMYFTRWRADLGAGKAYLGLWQGWWDVNHRWVVTGSWSEWAPEVAWMTLYFTGAVWVMISLIHAPRYVAEAPSR